MLLANTLPMATPPWKGVGRGLESAIRKAIFDFNLIDEKDQVIGIALSGGKDSLTLLFMLHALSGRGLPPFRLHAFLVSGSFSCGASLGVDYLKKVCEKLEIPLEVMESEESPSECYSCSRKRRKLIFEKAKGCGVTKIAFGHHRDDSIQTLLLNLFHKGEFAANLPKVKMHRYGIEILRPLIYVSEDKILRFAEQHGFFRITCKCPIGAKSQRAEVKEIILSLERRFPSLRENLACAATLYGSDKANRELHEP